MAMDKTVNYKEKYLGLRSKFISSMDVAYRLGYEQASKDAVIQQAQQQMQQAQMQQQAMMQQQAQVNGQQAQGAGGEQPQDGSEAQGMADQSGGAESPAGSDVDQYISQIENIVNKSENMPNDLKKAIQDMKLAKSKSGLSLNHTHSLPEHDKKVLTKQEEIVESLMKKWDEESKSVTDDILKTVKAV